MCRDLKYECLLIQYCTAVWNLPLVCKPPWVQALTAISVQAHHPQALYSSMAWPLTGFLRECHHDCVSAPNSLFWVVCMLRTELTRPWISTGCTQRCSTSRYTIKWSIPLFYAGFLSSFRVLGSQCQVHHRHQAHSSQWWPQYPTYLVSWASSTPNSPWQWTHETDHLIFSCSWKEYCMTFSSQWFVQRRLLSSLSPSFLSSCKFRRQWQWKWQPNIDPDDNMNINASQSTKMHTGWWFIPCESDAFMVAHPHLSYSFLMKKCAI